MISLKIFSNGADHTPFMGTAITVQQRLMRHSDIQTTLNIYGDIVTDEMEQASSKIAGLALNPDSKVIPAVASH